MNTFPLDLADLVPKETTFTLAAMPSKTFTLCKWSLRVRSWATTKYTSQGLKLIFEQQRINEIAEMAWFMLREKDQFPLGFDVEGGFLDSISSMQDQLNLIKALLGAIGIGEPELKKIEETLGAIPKAEKQDPKPKAPKKIGAKSLTP